MSSRSILALICAMILVSCDKEEADVKKPEIDVKLHKSTGVVLDAALPLRGNIMVQATTDEVSSIMISLDNQIVFQQEEIVEASAEIDTRLLENGSHHLKVEAVDKNKNTSIFEIDIQINNLLFSYSYPARSDAAPITWMIISDGQGNILDYKQMGVTNTVFQYPLGYDEETFDITLVNPDNFGYRSLYTVKGIQAGSYTAIGGGEVPTAAGTFTITKEEFNSWNVNYSALELIFTLDNNVESVLTFKKSSSPLYIWSSSQNGDNEYRYKSFTAQVGESVHVDKNYINNEMIPMLEQSVSGPVSDYFTYVLGTWTNSSEQAFCSASFTNQPVAYYPIELLGNTFSDFYTIFNRNFEEGNFSGSITSSGPMDARGVVQSMDGFDVAIATLTEQKYPRVKATFSGTADYLELYFENPDAGQDIWRWTVRAPFSSSVDIVVPNLTEAFRIASGLTPTPTLNLGSINLVESSVTDDYQDVAANIFGQPFAPSKDFKTKFYYVTIPPSGGRMKGNTLQGMPPFFTCLLPNLPSQNLPDRKSD